MPRPFFVPSRQQILTAFLGAGLLAPTGCDWGQGPPPRPSSLTPVAGLDQEATVGKPVPIPPAIQVLNKKGKPMRGQEVLFSVSSGGGQVSVPSVMTGEDGIARVGAWILGTTAGVQALQAQVTELPPVFFSATGLPDVPTSIKRKNGDGQVGVVGGTLAVPPTVVLKDAYQNLIGGARVSFLITGGGGFIEQTTGVTDASGIASAGGWTLGTVPGPNTLQASVPSLAPVSFSAQAIPDVPHRLTVLLGDGQVGQVGTALPVLPTLLVADRFGNLLEGVQVTFEVKAGGGTIQGASQVSGPEGVVVSGPWTLGPMAGIQVLEVQVPGLEPLAIHATADAGPPVQALAQGGGLQTATVGTEVQNPPTVRVEDIYGNPVPHISVTFTPSGSPDPEKSPGVIGGPDATTDEMGLASAGSWTMGTRTGAYSASAEVQGLAETVTFFATATADSPVSVAVSSGDNQTARFGTSVTEPPSVRVADQFGNGVPHIAVEFVVVEGEGGVSDGVVETEWDGIATVGAWILGPTPGVNRLTASAGEVGFVTFRATALGAEPAALTKVRGDGQSTQVGTLVPEPPEVRVTDQVGSPIGLVPVRFTVVSGEGSVAQGEAVTDSDGRASVGGWTLGTVAGPNNLSASVSGLEPVTFSADGTPGPPEEIWKVDGDSQSALVGTPVPLPPSVLVEDSYGNPIPSLAVTFTVIGGGGSVAGGSATTDGGGVARVGAWNLGPLDGINRLGASSAGLPTVVFEAMGRDAGGFDLQLDYQTAVDPAIAAVFDAAASRWEGIIVGDLPGYSGTLPVGGCQPVAEESGVEDLKVYVTVKPIDGPGGVLGRAGPCYYWTVGGVFPLTGIMEFDEADLLDLHGSGVLQDVIVHEMAHVLGFGTLWNASSNDFLVGSGTADPHFVGPAATLAFDDVGGTVRTASKVPVENTGGPGTRNGHWRESVHNSELMTGWIEGGGSVNPLSAITIASFADMGYTVNMNAADPYVLFNPHGAPGRGPGRGSIYIEELPPPIPIPVGPGGGR